MAKFLKFSPEIRKVQRRPKVAPLSSIKSPKQEVDKIVFRKQLPDGRIQTTSYKLKDGRTRGEIQRDRRSMLKRQAWELEAAKAQGKYIDRSDLPEQWKGQNIPQTPQQTHISLDRYVGIDSKVLFPQNMYMPDGRPPQYALVRTDKNTIIGDSLNVPLSAAFQPDAIARSNAQKAVDIANEALDAAQGAMKADGSNAAWPKTTLGVSAFYAENTKGVNSVITNNQAAAALSDPGQTGNYPLMLMNGQNARMPRCSTDGYVVQTNTTSDPSLRYSVLAVSSIAVKSDIDGFIKKVETDGKTVTGDGVKTALSAPFQPDAGARAQAQEAANTASEAVKAYAAAMLKDGSNADIPATEGELVRIAGYSDTSANLKTATIAGLAKTLADGTSIKVNSSGQMEATGADEDAMKPDGSNQTAGFIKQSDIQTGRGLSKNGDAVFFN